MRIAVVDDIAKERTLLLKRLKKQFADHNVLVDFSEYENGEDFLKAAEKNSFTVAFLDIYMTGISGMEAARELRKSDQTCLLVFTTTSTDHALEGFQVRATQYLVKPYKEDTLSSLVEEILARTPKPDKYITVKVNGSDVQLPLKDIVYAEHFSHMIYIHTVSQKTLSTRQSFENFTSGLKEDSRFFPCSRGAVVNLEHVADLADASFVMDEGSTVLISRKLVKTARQVFMDFLFQGGH